MSQYRGTEKEKVEWIDGRVFAGVKNEVGMFSGKRTQLEITILRELNESQKHGYCILSLILAPRVYMGTKNYIYISFVKVEPSRVLRRTNRRERKREGHKGYKEECAQYEVYTCTKAFKN